MAKRIGAVALAVIMMFGAFVQMDAAHAASVANLSARKHVRHDAYATRPYLSHLLWTACRLCAGTLRPDPAAVRLWLGVVVKACHGSALRRESLRQQHDCFGAGLAVF